MEADPHSGAPEPTAVRSDIGAPVALSPAQLYRAADASALNFATTAELSPLDGLIGQQRALGALQFGPFHQEPFCIG